MGFDRHPLGDFAAHVFATGDAGRTWRRLELGVDPVEMGWVNVAARHPRSGELLFVGAERGLFMSLARGASWSRLGGGLPRVPVDEVVIHPREDDLVAGTRWDSCVSRARTAGSITMTACLSICIRETSSAGPAADHSCLAAGHLC